MIYQNWIKIFHKKFSEIKSVIKAPKNKKVDGLCEENTFDILH